MEKATWIIKSNWAPQGLAILIEIWVIVIYQQQQQQKIPLKDKKKGPFYSMYI